MHSNIDLINREGEAIEEAVAWHTVGMVADDSQSIGTGSAILWPRGECQDCAATGFKDSK